MTITCAGWVILDAQLTCIMPEPPVEPVICPPVRAWWKDFPKQVAAESRAVPTSELAKVAVESIGDCDIARACRRCQ